MDAPLFAAASELAGRFAPMGRAFFMTTTTSSPAGGSQK